MAKGKFNGVNATRTSFAATGKDYGNNPGSRSFRRFSSIDTQEPLATQFSARPPSRESIASQDGDAGGYTAASFESQEGLATQFYPSNTRQNMLNADRAEPFMPNNAYDTGMLLGLLDRGNRQKPPLEQKSQQSVVESSSRRTKQTPTAGSITSATLNNARDGRSPLKNSINGSRPKPSPKQQSQRLPSDFSSRRTNQTPTPNIGTSTTSNNVRNERPPSGKGINGIRRKPSPEQQPQYPISTTSSDLGTNDERDGQEYDFMIPSQPKIARNSSQSQRRRSISEGRSSQRPKKASEKGVEGTDMNLEDEVTSFQVHLPSSSDTTAPIAKAGGNPVKPPEERSGVTRTQLTEPARREKRSHRDPWSGMTKLRRRDVVIPEDQEELLERKDCWIPPDVGQPYPQGHVPPNLLWEWTTKMTRLFADARKTHASSQKAESSREQEDDHEDDQPPSPKPLSDEGESDSEAESEIPWSPSPPRDQPKSAAPPDSPTQQDNDRRPADITKKHANGTADPVDGVNLETQAGTPLSPSGVDQRADSTQDADASPDYNQGHNSNMSLQPRSTVQSPSKDHRSQDEVAELSDDSDMEMAVPQALLINSQDIASQIVFSGPLACDSSNVSSAPTGQVQILNTPAVALNRAAAKRTEHAPSHSQDWTAQQSSSGSNKSSSQLIANSLNDTEASSSHSHQLQDAQRPLVADSQITNGDLPGSSLSSHQDSQRLLEVIPDSSLRLSGPHTQVSPQRHESPQERVENGPSPSRAMVNGNGLKRRAAELEEEVIEESPSKQAKMLPDRTVDAPRIQNTVDADYDAVDQRNNEHASLNNGALRVYDMFKRSYPKYAGNFDHFQALCFDLQSLHRRGVLESSFLWDDFIMRHWVDYGTHVQKCISSGEEYESYEDFFCRNFTKPSFRKRNLTHRTLNIVVSSRLESSEQRLTTIEKGMQTIDDNSVSATVIRPLVADQCFKSTSKEPNTQSTTSDVSVVVDRPHQANIGVKLSASPKKRPVIVGGGIQVNLEPPTPSDHRLGEQPKEVEHENRAIEETPPPDIIMDEDIVDNEREITPENFTSDYHDTASIELGLDVMEEILISHQDDEDGNAPNTVEARFEQISRMRRDDAQAIQALFTTEVPPASEEEDASTPFKTWARDDQNIVSERRRRGGYEVPLDENGNIVVEEFPRVIDEENEEEVLPPYRRWIWPRRFWNRNW
ncbi:hypothetical protein DPV78_006313 [Talaromyces pinophilus]|nr:hypothetical protein DPV78_006313 [Talaromyces pinophilus]